MTIDAALDSPLASAHVVRFDFAQPIDEVLLDNDAHWLDLSLTPRLHNARACYANNWKPHRFEPLGEVYMVPAGQPFHARGDSGRHTAVLCLLRSEATRDQFETGLAWTDRRLEASLNIRSANIRNLLMRLGEEARSPGFASEALTEAIAQQLVIELVRYYASPVVGRSGGCGGGLSTSRLRLIDERVNDLTEAPTLTELARLCNLSVRQLTRAFRVSRGCSIGDYIARTRIENAKRMLEADESIKVVAYSMGFASPASFCYAFRRATRQSPGEYRRHARGTRVS